MLNIIIFFFIHLNSNYGTVVARHIVEAYKVPPLSVSQETITSWKKYDQQLHDYISTSIPEALAHTGASSFDSHLKGVQSVLRNWGSDEVLVNAGLFHSIYGTEGFQGYKLPLSKRADIRKLIGREAERLVWIFCMVDRSTVDDSLYVCEQQDTRKFEFRARPELGNFPIILDGEKEWLDFLELTLADWLEQVEGAAEKANHIFEWAKGEAWSYRRVAYLKMADILVLRRGKHIAKQMHTEIYAVEPENTRKLHQIITPPMSSAAKEAREAMLSALDQ